MNWARNAITGGAPLFCDGKISIFSYTTGEISPSPNIKSSSPVCFGVSHAHGGVVHTHVRGAWVARQPHLKFKTHVQRTNIFPTLFTASQEFAFSRGPPALPPQKGILCMIIRIRETANAQIEIYEYLFNIYLRIDGKAPCKLQTVMPAPKLLSWTGCWWILFDVEADKEMTGIKLHFILHHFTYYSWSIDFYRGINKWNNNFPCVQTIHHVCCIYNCVIPL